MKILTTLLLLGISSITLGQVDTGAYLARIYILSEDTASGQTMVLEYNTNADSVREVDRIYHLPAVDIIEGDRRLIAAVGDSLIEYAVPDGRRKTALRIGPGRIRRLGNSSPQFAAIGMESDSSGKHVYLLDLGADPMELIDISGDTFFLPPVADLSSFEFVNTPVPFSLFSFARDQTRQEDTVGYFWNYAFDPFLSTDSSDYFVGRLSNGLYIPDPNIGTRIFQVLSEPDTLIEISEIPFFSLTGHPTTVDFHVSGPGQQVVQVEDTIFTSFDGGWGGIDIISDSVVHTSLIDTPYSYVFRDTPTGNWWAVGSDSSGGFIRNVTSTGDIIKELDLVNDPQLAAGVYNRRPRLRPNPSVELALWYPDVPIHLSDLGYEPDGDDFILSIPSFPPPKYISPTYDEIIYEVSIPSAGDTVLYALVDIFDDSTEWAELIVKWAFESISAPWGSDISFYPNPVTTALEISYPESTQMNTVEILTATGQLVLSNKAGPIATTIHMEELPTGLYLIRLTDTDDQVQIFRVMKGE